MNNETKFLNASEFLAARNNRTLTIQLPDFPFPFIAKPMQVETMIINGIIPQELYKVAMDGIDTGVDGILDAAKLAASLVDLERYLNIVLESTLIDPVVVAENPDREKNEITVDDLTVADKQIYLAELLDATREWKRFLGTS